MARHEAPITHEIMAKDSYSVFDDTIGLDELLELRNLLAAAQIGYKFFDGNQVSGVIDEMDLILGLDGAD